MNRYWKYTLGPDCLAFAFGLAAMADLLRRAEVVDGAWTGRDAEGGYVPQPPPCRGRAGRILSEMEAAVSTLLRGTQMTSSGPTGWGDWASLHLDRLRRLVREANDLYRDVVRAEAFEWGPRVSD